MKLIHLDIALQHSWQDNANQYVATIQYEDKNKNAVKLVLDPEISGKLLGFCGPVITAAAARAAHEIETNIIGSLEEAQRPKEITV